MAIRFSAPQNTALDWLNRNHAALSADHMTIWNLHEPSWREYKSSAWYMDRLVREGFEVERGTAGMPAFRARWSNGTGPTLAGYPNQTQCPGRATRAAAKTARRDKFRAAGHTDPHSALGIGSFGGFLAAKHAMEAHGLKGTLVYFGEPAEDVRIEARPRRSRLLQWSRRRFQLPSAFVSRTHQRDTIEICRRLLWSRIYTFECEHPETWQSEIVGGAVTHAHAIARAPGAIDAVCLMYTNSKMMKESMLPRAGN